MEFFFFHLTHWLLFIPTYFYHDMGLISKVPISLFKRHSYSLFNDIIYMYTVLSTHTVFRTTTTSVKLSSSNFSSLYFLRFLSVTWPLYSLFLLIFYPQMIFCSFLLYFWQQLNEKNWCSALSIRLLVCSLLQQL